MSRIVNILFALVLLLALVIAVDPQARQRATAAVRAWEPTLKQLDTKIVVNAPSISVTDTNKTPMPEPTATAVASNHQIPVTGDEDTTNKPIIQINWDALGQTLREFWTRLMAVRIEFNPAPNDRK